MNDMRTVQAGLDQAWYQAFDQTKVVCSGAVCKFLCIYNDDHASYGAFQVLLQFLTLTSCRLVKTAECGPVSLLSSS